MNVVAVHVLLTVIWAALLGTWDLGALVLGVVVAYAALYLLYRDHPRGGRYFRRLAPLLALVGYYLWELVRSNVRVAREIVTPGYTMRPGMIVVPLAAETDLEITLLANLISMTPGSLALEVTADRRALHVHVMDLADADADAVRATIRDKLERRLLAVLR